jgi:hypothetical protein
MGSTVMKLDDALAGLDRLGLDTPPFIYLIERNLTYLDLVREVFRRITSKCSVSCRRMLDIY